MVQVDLPRLNILLDGQLPDQALGDNAPPLEANDVLYILAIAGTARSGKRLACC